MRLGPELIKSCPHCQGTIPQKTLLSWNNAGATTWTDGRIQGPGVPDIHPLARCPHCSGLVWLDDLPTLSQRTKPPPGCFSALLGWLLRQPGEPCLEVAVPNAEDCWQALAMPGLSKERLRYLRRRIWWLDNDLRRHDPSGEPLSQQQRDNMLALSARGAAAPAGVVPRGAASLGAVPFQPSSHKND